jgi:ATP-binding cassette subfamily B protein
MKSPSRKKVWGTLAALAEMVRIGWKAHPLGFVCTILFEVVLGLLPVASAWVTKLLFDQLAGHLLETVPTVLSESIFVLLVLQATILFIGRLTTPVLTYITTAVGQQLSISVQSVIYRKINSLAGLASFEDPDFYDTLRLATASAEQGPPQALAILMSLTQSTITLVGLLSLLLSFNSILALAVSLTILPQLYAQFKISNQRYNLAVENSPRERQASYYGYILAVPQFAKEIRLFGIGEYFLEGLISATKEIHRAKGDQQKRELFWQAGLAVMTSLVAGAAFATVIYQALEFKISVGDVTLYISAVASLQAGLMNITMAVGGLDQSAQFFGHYNRLLRMPQPLLVVGSSDARKITPLMSGIEFRNVSFRYSDEHPWILRDLDLKIPAHHCVALVGANGAGKTTLVKLLTRMYDPTKGHVLWDGVDIRDFNPADLRQRVAAVFQDFARYDLTAQENIGLGDIPNMGSMEFIRQAALQAGVHNTIDGLPQGYQTLLSRWLAVNVPGVDLSTGEWQKIALARMFMRSADLLILDEPTASLDVQTEHELYVRFPDLIRGNTALLITHRFSTVQMADIVAVLEEGRITEYDTHERLLKLNGAYAHMYTMQADQYKQVE